METVEESRCYWEGRDHWKSTKETDDYQPCSLLRIVVSGFLESQSNFMLDRKTTIRPPRHENVFLKNRFVT